MKKLYFYVIFLFFFCSGQEVPLGEKIAVSLGMKDNPESPFYLDLENYPESGTAEFQELPIGVFDSGTGGLTVLEEILKYDGFDNTTGRSSENGDGTPDFKKEDFVYYGDLANMPYGIYDSEGRSDFLKELCVKDAFLLLNRYYDSVNGEAGKKEKGPVKIIVIACNTGTAYGKQPIEEMLKYMDLNVHVIGVVGAGAKGALEYFSRDESGTIGVMATIGTLSSGAYPKNIRDLLLEEGYSGEIDIIEQGGYGLAEAIDNDPEFININWKGTNIRENYRGPSFQNKDFTVKKDMLDVYNFSNLNNELLKKKNNGELVNIQLNSVRNYTRYHVTELILKIKEKNVKMPLKAIILGCTHYPYVEDEITGHLEFLADFTDKSGTKPFSDILSSNVQLVDPAELTARETFMVLKEANSLKKTDRDVSKFFLSVPNKNLPGVKYNEQNRFEYDYKYGRLPFYLSTEKNILPPKYVYRIPMSWHTLNDVVTDQIRSRLPNSYALLKQFNEGIH